MNMSIFSRSHVIVVSQLNPMHIVISITSVVVEWVVISSYRSRIRDEECRDIFQISKMSDIFDVFDIFILQHWIG